MPFYKIRRYIPRAGRRLGCGRDSPPLPNEHLMIIFFDCLLLDTTDCVFEPYVQRRRSLAGIVCPIPGHAIIGESRTMDINSHDAPFQVTKELAHAISHQREGLVFKPCQASYLASGMRQQYQVKMRKDMIPGLGDAADLVVVGGGHDANGDTSERWTTFYLACVDDFVKGDNDDILPSFRIVAVVSRPAISVVDMRFLS